MGKGGDAIEKNVIVNQKVDNFYSKTLIPPENGGTHRDGFYHSEIDEPHALRRKEILKKYPEIQSLFGSDIRPLPFVLLIMFSQLYLGIYGIIYITITSLFISSSIICRVFFQKLVQYIFLFGCMDLWRCCKSFTLIDDSRSYPII